MTQQRIQLWVALVCLATGALMLHYRIHTPQGRLTYFWASFFGGTDLVVVSLLFLFKRTAVWALLANSFLAFLGIIMMADFSISATLAGKIALSPMQDPLGWLLLTLFPDIGLACADFLVGLALYRTIMADSKSVRN